MSRRHGRGEVLALIKHLAARPEGVTTGDLTARMGRPSNSPILPNAAAAGHIFKAHRLGSKVRWYTTQEAADAWLALGPVPRAPKLPRGWPRKTETVARPRVVRPRKPPKPKAHQNVTFSPAKPKPAAVGGEVIVPASARITVAPALADHRFAVPADYRGPFSLAGIGRDVQTGRAWGA